MFGFLFGKKKLKLKEPVVQEQTVDDWKGPEITLRNEVEKMVTEPCPTQPGKYVELFEQLVYLNKHLNRVHDAMNKCFVIRETEENPVLGKIESEMDTEYLGKIIDPICIDKVGEVYTPDLRVCYNGNRFLPGEKIGFTSLIVLHYRQVSEFIQLLTDEDATRNAYIIMKLTEFHREFNDRFSKYHSDVLCCAYTSILDDLLDPYKTPEALAARNQAQLLLTPRKK